ncbi:hypothetical protein FACS1894140_3650 [Spirochaetia bacterium]|nr:hypothetical protein FACS1894140_3650 [Spirochaetia bacterium]
MKKNVKQGTKTGDNKKVDATLGPTAAGNLSTTNAADSLWLVGQ